MAAEVKLKKGWLTKDIDRASKRIDEWRTESTKKHTVTLAHTNKNQPASNTASVRTNNINDNKS